MGAKALKAKKCLLKKQVLFAFSNYVPDHDFGSITMPSV